jgi:hypothetical protein
MTNTVPAIPAMPGHDNEQIAPRQAIKVGPDEERRLDHADEDVGCLR